MLAGFSHVTSAGSRVLLCPVSEYLAAPPPSSNQKVGERKVGTVPRGRGVTSLDRLEPQDRRDGPLTHARSSACSCTQESLSFSAGRAAAHGARCFRRAGVEAVSTGAGRLGHKTVVPGKSD